MGIFKLDMLLAGIQITGKRQRTLGGQERGSHNRCKLHTLIPVAAVSDGDGNK